MFPNGVPGPTFQSGTILVEDGTILPGAMALEGSVLSQEWRSVLHLDRIGIEAELAKAGWTFFYMAGVVQKLGFGFDADKRTRAAVGRVIRDVQGQSCNCLEITHLANRSFLGIPYTSVTAHARHIQNGCQFGGR